jgi:hypothetical protein
LSVSVPASKMFDNYLYVSSTTAKFRKHFEEAAEKYISEFNLGPSTLVVDIGSNDGIAIKPLKEKQIPVVGVEPAKNIAELANKNNIPTINEYFKKETVDKILNQYGKAALVTASNVFAHSDELKDIANNVFDLLNDKGSFVIEVQYLKDTIKDLTFDNIYHEHYNYWSVTSLNNFFNRLNLCVYKVEHIDTHGGSIRVYISRQGCNIDPSVEKFIQEEKDFGITNFSIYEKFANDINAIKIIVNKNIKYLKNKYGKIAAYGSPAKATTSLNYFGINNTHINYTIDDNIMKHGKFIPGVNIPIKNKNYALDNLPKVLIVLAWNFFDYIKENNKNFLEKDVVFLNIKELEKNNSIEYKVCEMEFSDYLD